MTRMMMIGKDKAPMCALGGRKVFLLGTDGSECGVCVSERGVE